MKLLSIQKQLQLIFSKATLQAFYFPKPVTFQLQRLSKYHSKISHEVFNSHRQKQFKQIESQISPSSIAYQIRDLVDYPNKEFEINVGQFGYIQIELKNYLLENYMNSILSSKKFSPYMSELFLNSKLISSPSQNRVIFPILDILQDFSINNYRHWLRLQSIARIHQFFNNTIKRVSVVSNNLPFHGVVFKYMKQNPGQSASMQNIVNYLQKNKIDSHDLIQRVGRETLENLKNDDQMFEVHQQITKQKFVKSSDLFDSGRTERLKSKDLGKQLSKDIIVELSKSQVYFNHISCRRHQILEYEQLQKQHNLNLIIHKIGQIHDGQNNIQTLFKTINQSITQRLKLNIPQFEGKIQKKQQKWLNYLMSTIAPQQFLSVDPAEVTNLVFTKSNELLSLHQKTSLMMKADFKITCQADKNLALIAINVINHLERYQLSQVFGLLARYSNILKAHQTYAGNKLLELMLEQVYRISCLF